MQGAGDLSGLRTISTGKGSGGDLLGRLSSWCRLLRSWGSLLRWSPSPPCLQVVSHLVQAVGFDALHLGHVHVGVTLPVLKQFGLAQLLPAKSFSIATQSLGDLAGAFPVPQILLSIPGEATPHGTTHRPDVQRDAVPRVLPKRAGSGVQLRGSLLRCCLGGCCLLDRSSSLLRRGRGLRLGSFRGFLLVALVADGFLQRVLGELGVALDPRLLGRLLQLRDSHLVQVVDRLRLRLARLLDRCSTFETVSNLDQLRVPGFAQGLDSFFLADLPVA